FLGLVGLQQLRVGFQQFGADAPDHVALGIGSLGARTVDDVARSGFHDVSLDARGFLEVGDQPLDDVRRVRGVDADALLRCGWNDQAGAKYGTEREARNSMELHVSPWQARCRRSRGASVDTITFAP